MNCCGKIPINISLKDKCTFLRMFFFCPQRKPWAQWSSENSAVRLFAGDERQMMFGSHRELREWRPSISRTILRVEKSQFVLKIVKHHLVLCETSQRTASPGRIASCSLCERTAGQSANIQDQHYKGSVTGFGEFWATSLIWLLGV